MTTPLRPVPPYLTSDLPGIGGELKRQPEDFVVEELPAYEPCGTGEHLFLWIEKRDVSAEQLVSHVARTLKVPTNEVGVAGLKDRRAVTRQYVSVPVRCEPRLGEVTSPAIVLLKSTRHQNKLKTGHLRGNRFDILLRNPVKDAEQRARRIGERLAAGFPNLYGEQRFGAGNETLQLGLDLLTGRRTARDIPHRRRRFLLRLSLSSVQSALFNEVLARRLEEGLLHRVLRGDVMQVVASGGPFVVEDPAVEQPRFDAGETVITGPMFGPDMKAPEGEVLAREAEVLAACNLRPEQFVEWRRLASGTRRPLLVRWFGFDVVAVPEGLRLQFDLPKGTYATMLLREFQKEAAEDRSRSVDGVA